MKLRGLSVQVLSAIAGVMGLAAAASAAETLVVSVFTMDFSMDGTSGTPRDPTIYVGDTIRWNWGTGAGIHSVTSIAGSSEVYSDGPVGPTHTFDHTFTTTGVHQYYCTVHGADTGGAFSGMGGTITVKTALAGWTFESATISGTATDNGPHSAEFGALTPGAEARGHHASASTAWTSPAGNGSAKAYSSNNWAIGDYYQFKGSTTGYQNIYFAWDQTRSSTGPATFDIACSLDGSAFTTIVSGYAVSDTPGFSGTTFRPTHRYSAVALPSSLADAPVVYVRVRCAAAPGGTAGTNRIDNVVISGEAIPSCAAPTISDDPDDLTVAYGDPASFSVTASGSGSLSYQWRKDGVDLSDGGTVSGSTTDTLSISACDVGDEAVYDCVVTNDCGFATTDATSAGATLTVECDSPAITDDPDSVVTASHGTTVLSATASGTGTLAYQWRKDTVDLSDGGRISGATMSTLTISPTGYADEGTYDVVVTGACGSATSAGADVTTVCGPDCDGNHVLNVNDFICFKSKWDARTAYGDYNGDGKWNIRDFTAYQVDFNSLVSQGGCLN